MARRKRGRKHPRPSDKVEEIAKRQRAYSLRGNNIRAYRVRRMHWRQEDLAKAAGLSVGQISRIENGQHLPQVATIVRIARALEVSVDELVNWHVGAEENAA